MLCKVGIRTIHYVDTERSNWQGTGPRPLVTTVWYPAVDTAIERDVFVGPPDAPLFRAGKAAYGVELVSAPNLFPLIMLSHGTGGAALQLGWLASHLASHGYIVAGVNHHGNTALEPYTVEGFVLWWERAQDISVVLDQLREDSGFGERIN